MVLSRHEDELILYWSYKNSSIARYQLSRKEMDVKTLSDGKWIQFQNKMFCIFARWLNLHISLHSDKAIFLGIGYNEKLYLYSPTSKNINVYDFDSGSKLIELSGLQDTNTDMHCVDVDPLHKEFVFCVYNKLCVKTWCITNNKLGWLLQAINYIITNLLITKLIAINVLVMHFWQCILCYNRLCLKTWCIMTIINCVDFKSNARLSMR